MLALRKDVMATVVVGAMLVGAVMAGITDNCMDLGLISFGCSEEHHIDTETIVEDKVVEKLDQQNESTVKMTTETRQTVTVVTKNPHATIGKITVVQGVTGNIKFVAKVTQKLAGDLRTVLKTDVNERIKNLGTDTKLFFEKNTNGITTEKVKTALYSAIEQVTEEKNLNTILFKVSNDQEVNIYLYAKYIGNLEITQNIALEVFARAVVEQAATAAMKSEVIKDLKRVLETSGGATEGYSGTTIAAIVILMAIVAFGAYYYINKNKKADTQVVVVQSPKGD
jgi:hypothetical protein